MRSRRPPPRITLSLLPLTTAAVATMVLVGTWASAQVFRAQGSSDAPVARASSQFGIRVGSVAGLHPGGEVSVRVSYTNPFSYSLVVGSQKIRVSSPSPACPATYVDLTPALTVLSKPVVIPARRTTALTIGLSMRATAPDACQGVRFTTTIEAQGRKK